MDDWQQWVSAIGSDSPKAAPSKHYRHPDRKRKADGFECESMRNHRLAVGTSKLHGGITNCTEGALSCNFFDV